MNERSARDLSEIYTRALNERDWDTLASILHPDYHVDFPQSGERIRGFKNVRAMFESYPGELPPGTTDSTVVTGEDRWIVGPNFTMIRVTGTPEFFTTVTRAKYPDGTEWFVIAFVRAEAGRMRSATAYFAPDFPAPEWRTPLAERIPGWGA